MRLKLGQTKPAAATPLLAAVPKARVVNEGKGKNKGVSKTGATKPAVATPLLAAVPKARVMDEGKGTFHSHGKP